MGRTLALALALTFGRHLHLHPPPPPPPPPPAPPFQPHPHPLAHPHANPHAHAHPCLHRHSGPDPAPSGPPEQVRRGPRGAASAVGRRGARAPRADQDRPPRPGHTQGSPSTWAKSPARSRSSKATLLDRSAEGCGHTRKSYPAISARPPEPTAHLPRAHPTCPVHMAARRRADVHPALMPPPLMPCQAQLMNSHTVVHAQLTAEAAQAAPP